MPRSVAITGMHTVNSPASRLLIPVMHVMERMIATVRLVDGVGCVTDGTGVAPKPGEECEGVTLLELTLAALGTDSTNSIVQSWACVTSVQVDKNTDERKCAAAIILRGDTRYLLTQERTLVCTPVYRTSSFFC